jgi:NADH-quinone oxidoreductase subunit L
MAFALIVLAVGSILTGYVGIPAALGGSDRLGRFLAPSFASSQIAAPASGTSAEAEPSGEAAEELELGLMGVSTAAAVAGIGIALFFFYRNREAANRLAERFIGVYTVLTNKYYVDEIYDAAVVQPIRIVADEGLWKVVDVRVIDGSVNGVAESVRGWSELLRRLQTGSVRAYAASLLFGVVALLGYYLWR